jgi:hypothetical protein
MIAVLEPDSKCFRPLFTLRRLIANPRPCSRRDLRRGREKGIAAVTASARNLPALMCSIEGPHENQIARGLESSDEFV